MTRHRRLQAALDVFDHEALATLIEAAIDVCDREAHCNQLSAKRRSAYVVELMSARGRLVTAACALKGRG